MTVAGPLAPPLFNGDIGIRRADHSGAPMAGLPDDDPRTTIPSPITMQKAHGSELYEVWLVVAGRHNRVLSREPVYTGMATHKQAA